MLDFTVKVPAMQYYTAGRLGYSFALPVKTLLKIINFSEEGIDPELSYQRDVNWPRARKIADYIWDNPMSYAFPAITLISRGTVSFEKSDETGGSSMCHGGALEVGISGDLIVVDGQHRLAAFTLVFERHQKAMRDAKTKADSAGLPHGLLNECITAVMFMSRGLDHEQQVFSDINRSTVKPNKSLNILFDNRDQLGLLTKLVVREVEMFTSKTEKTKTSISSKGDNLFTVASIYEALQIMFGKYPEDIGDMDEVNAIDMFNGICQNMPDWKKDAADLRENTVHAHSVGFMALARVAIDLDGDYRKLKGLKKIDWSRSNPEWSGRCIIDGRMTKNGSSILLTSAYIKTMLDIPLTALEEIAETDMISRKDTEI